MAKEQLQNAVLTAETTAAAKPDYENEIIAVIRGNDSPKAMLRKLEDYHAHDIAEVLETLSIPERKKLCRICTVPMLAEVFEHLEEETAGLYLSEIDVQRAAAVIGELETDTAANVLHKMEKERRTLLIEMLPPDLRKEIRMIASFDEDEIGSKMTTNCIIIRENLTV